VDRIADPPAQEHSELHSFEKSGWVQVIAAYILIQTEAGKAARAPHVSPAATFRDGSRSAASAGRSRHGEHHNAQGEWAETLISEAY
jgi:hypothetical protein